MGRRPPFGYKRPGLTLGVFLGLIYGCAALVLVGALGVTIAMLVRERREAEATRALASRKAERREDTMHTDVDGAPELPTVTRHIPNHSLRVLEGCSDANLTTITDVLERGIDEASPQYNDGRFVDSYRTYVSAALELETGLPKSCGGPAEALANGRHTARSLDHASEQAWAMRDAFDGLRDVIARSRQAGGTSL